RKLALYAAGSFVTVITTILFNILFIAFMKLGAEGMLLATCLGNILCTIFLFASLKIYKYFNVQFLNKKLLKDMIKYSIPLIPNQLSLWIINSSDRTIVNMFIGAA